MTDQSLVEYKFILVGSSCVGKTSILRRLVDNEFNEDMVSTIGVEFDCVPVEIDNEKIVLRIWDTAGQERFRSIIRAYFRNAIGVLLVFDLKARSTFDEVSAWLKDIRSLCEPDVCVMLIGNKSDLASSRQVTLAEAEDFARLNNIKYMETSALSGSNIKEAFYKVASDIHRKKKVSSTAAQAPKLSAVEGSNKIGCC